MSLLVYFQFIENENEDFENNCTIEVRKRKIR